MEDEDYDSAKIPIIGDDDPYFDNDEIDLDAAVNFAQVMSEFNGE